MWTSEHLAVLGWRWPGMVAWVVAFGLVGFRAFAIEELEPVHLGHRGRRRKHWTAKAARNAVLDRVLRRVGAWVQPGLSNSLSAAFDRRLKLAGDPWGWRPAELVAASACAGMLGVVIAATWSQVLDSGGWIVWSLAPVLAVAPWVQVQAEMKRRVSALERSLPVAMDLIALCVRAGGDFPGALGFVVEELSESHGACREELRMVLEMLSVGRARAEALQALADRVDSAAVRELVASLVQAERRGVPLAESLRAQAQTLRRIRSVRAEEAAAQAGVRMVVPLMLMLGSILCVLVGPMLLEGIAL